MGTRIETQNFEFPLDVYAELLLLETGSVDYLHYGLFAPGVSDIVKAQEQHTMFLLERLPVPPARILEIGIGTGTMLAQLCEQGYAAVGISPDPAQIRIAHEKASGAVLIQSKFENFYHTSLFDAVVFQESSQYIDAAKLFDRAGSLCAPHGWVIIIDEFSVGGVGGLQSLEYVLNMADVNGLSLSENVDLSEQVAPTLDYLLTAVPRRRHELEMNLSLEPKLINSLCDSNLVYQQRYSAGQYQYRCLTFFKDGNVS